MLKINPKQKISPRGENHFSKRRSESKSYSQYKGLNSKSEIKSESKDVKVKNENKLVALLTNAKAKMTAKADKAKALGKILAGFRMEIEKPLDKKIKSDPPATLPLHFATPFNISIFKSFLSDPSDHNFQIFTVGDLSDCKMLCLA